MFLYIKTLTHVDFMDEISKEVAELAGVIIGDGHIEKRGNRIEIVGNQSSDSAYLDKIAKLGEEAFRVKPRIFVREYQKELFLHPLRCTNILLKR
jgi:hypothetical protein